VWRNFVKSRSENRRDDPPAVALGLVSWRLRAHEILAARRFPWRQRSVRGSSAATSHASGHAR
jgi:hypothetical protein